MDTGFQLWTPMFEFSSQSRSHPLIIKINLSGTTMTDTFVKTHHSWGLGVLFQGGDLCSCQAASSFHPDRRVFVSRAVGSLHRGAGHRTGHGWGAKQTPRPAADHRLKLKGTLGFSTVGLTLQAFCLLLKRHKS